MANQYLNKLIIGSDVKFDLTNDDITADKLAKGIKAHDKSGAPIVGTSTFDADTSADTAAAAMALRVLALPITAAKRAVRLTTIPAASARPAAAERGAVPALTAASSSTTARRKSCSPARS